jgi:hypothetical protein
VATRDATVGTSRAGSGGGLFAMRLSHGRGVSWGAVFAGLLMGTAVQILLTMLGVAIGLGAADDSAKGASIGTGIWAVIAALIAAWLGGRVAGTTARARERGDGAFHGLLAWALSTIIAVWLISAGAGKLLGGAASVAGNVAGGAASGLSQATATRPDAVRGNAQEMSQNAQQPEVRANADTLKQRAAEAADTARKVAKNAAWIALVGMILTALASALGGAGGARDDHDDVVIARDPVARPLV